MVLQLVVLLLLPIVIRANDRGVIGSGVPAAIAVVIDGKNVVDDDNDITVVVSGVVNDVVAKEFLAKNFPD